MGPDDIRDFVARAARQDQFLDVIGRDEAEARFRAHLALKPLGAERVTLPGILGRVLAEDVTAEVDVPGFDRSGVDGIAVRAADTHGASETAPVRLTLNDEVLSAGRAPARTVAQGTATVIATGGMLPRGADAVVMVEQTELADGDGPPAILVRKPASAGQFVAAAGSDIGRGEVVLRRGQTAGAREIAMLAAIGRADALVWRRPRVAILSTGDEIIAPGQPIRPGAVYDSNGPILAAAVEELGGEPVRLGVAPDDEAALEAKVREGLACDALLLSGGTSKGAGDLSHRIVARLGDPGIVVHGVALKPGKPLCLAVCGGKPVVILPGFPTSAMFTFHEFVAPVIRAMAGLPPAAEERRAARMPVRLPSERGRTEYVMVSLVEGEDGLAAYPLAKGSGAVTAFARADGFVAVEPQAEVVPEGTTLSVRLIGRAVEPADLIVIGSHCVGLDALLGELVAEGLSVKALNVGSMGGLAAARRGECDLAPIHLLDEKTGTYNRPLLPPGVELIEGYRRMQGIVFRPGDARFEGRTAEEAGRAAAMEADCILMNRNAGSGTRLLTERLLAGAKPTGYWTQAKSHNAVAVAVAQGRADWGVAIEGVAGLYGLGFLPLAEERYDVAVPAGRISRPAVARFRTALESPAMAERLAAMGFRR